VTTGKVVGLTCSPDILQSIRRARANTALGVVGLHKSNPVESS
jgi:regulator of PEP synthase PpsR (kinase-PPPase family)